MEHFEFALQVHACVVPENKVTENKARLTMHGAHATVALPESDSMNLSQADNFRVDSGRPSVELINALLSSLSLFSGFSLSIVQSSHSTEQAQLTNNYMANPELGLIHYSFPYRQQNTIQS